MPIYVYEVEGGECDKCGGQFELLEPLDRPPLTKCPLCKRPVGRIIAAAAVHSKIDVMREMEQAGFQAFTRDDDGQMVDKFSGKTAAQIAEERRRRKL